MLIITFFFWALLQRSAQLSTWNPPAFLFYKKIKKKERKIAKKERKQVEKDQKKEENKKLVEKNKNGKNLHFFFFVVVVVFK